MVSSQVAAALISGGAALVVALLGIAGAVVAQMVATRRAFANSLRLFEQEHGKRELEKAAEILREDEYRFADQRRAAYARLLRTASDLRMTGLAVDAAAEGWQHFHDLDLRWESPEARAEGEAWQLRKLQEAFPRWVQLRAEFDEIASEVELLGSADVRRGLAELGDIVTRVPDLGEARWVLDRPDIPFARHEVDPRERKFRVFPDARDAFLEAARADLGTGRDHRGPGTSLRST